MHCPGSTRHGRVPRNKKGEVGRILKKLVAAVLAFGAFGVAAQAADLPVKAKRLPAEPTWWVSGGALIWGVKGTPLPPTRYRAGS